jgi:hypothetical protein
MNNSRAMMNSLREAGFGAESRVMNREAYVYGVSYIFSMSGSAAGTSATITGNIKGN